MNVLHKHMREERSRCEKGEEKKRSKKRGEKRRGRREMQEGRQVPF